MRTPFSNYIKIKNIFGISLLIILFFITLLKISINNSKIENKVYAENDQKFSVEHEITYEIKEDGTALVTQNISLTNLDNDVIATNYTIITNQINTTEEQGLESEKSMSVTKEYDQTSNVYKLKAFFNKVEIGEGAVKNFTISYKTRDILYKTGDIWYINIPKSDITTQTTSYNVRLIVPKTLGNKIFVSPKPQLEKNETENATTYFFTKENLLNSGITSAFGNYQVLNFKLLYQIDNDTKLNSTYEIALPPDIEDYQHIAFTKIDPEPKKLYRSDEDNIIAEYKVYSGEKLEIEVTGSAKLSTKQINPIEGGTFEELPKELKSKYTGKEKYWDIKNESILEITNKLQDTNLTVAENAQNIYDYIVNNFKYDNNATNNQYLERKGAVKSLDKNQALACMEFTDIFVTLARSMGIPAREINGYAFTNNNVNLPSSINIKGVDLLHSWAEFYDPNFGWVQVDPTWGTTSKVDYFTKLDTNHLSFVIRGKDSEYPLPAGMYRYEDNKKLINVDFANEKKEGVFDTNINIKETFNFSPIHWLLGYKRYEIENIGNTFIYNINKKTLGPKQKTKLFIHKDTQTIEYKDFNGNKNSIKISNQVN